MLKEDMDNFKLMTKNTENKRFSRKNILILALFMLFFCMGGSLWGQTPPTFRWTGGANTTNWNDNGNWSPSGPVTSNAEVTIGAASGITYYPEIKSDITIAKLTIEDGTKTIKAASLSITGATLTVTGVTVNNGFLYINNASTGTKGTLKSDTLTNNANIENSGILNVTDSITNNSGTLKNKEGAELTTNSFTNNAYVDNNGKFTSSTELKNTGGNIKNDSKGTITSPKVENAGSITNNNTDSNSVPDVASGGNSVEQGSKVLTTDQNFDGTTDTTQYEKIILTGNTDQEFKPSSTYEYPLVEIQKTGGTVTFINTPKITEITDNSQSGSPVDIVFENGGTIGGTIGGATEQNLIFTTKGTVTIKHPFSVDGTLEHKGGNTVLIGTAADNSISAKSITLGTVGENQEISITNRITAASQTYNTAVTIDGGAVLDASTDITFNSTVTGTGSAAPLTIEGTGSTKVTFNGNVESVTSVQISGKPGSSGGSPTAVLEITLPEKIISTGDQTYIGKINLVKATTLSAPGNSITLNGDIAARGNNLIISDSATTEFKNNITETTTNIADLKVTASKEIKLPAEVTTTGAQTYNGLISSTADTTLKSTGDAVITVNGSASTFNQNITFNTKGNVIFDTALFKAKTITHTDGPTELKNDIEAETINFKDLSISNATSNKVTIKATNPYENTGTLTIPKGKISEGQTLIVDGNFNNNGTINNEGTLRVTGNFTDSGTYGTEGTIELNGTENQEFTAKNNTTYECIKVTKGSSTSVSTVTFKNKLKVNNLKAKRPIIFNNGAEITNNFKISSGAVVTITINGGKFKVANFENFGTFNLSKATDIYVDGDFTDTGTFDNSTYAITIHLMGNPITSKTTQTFTPGTTIYDNVIIDNETSVPVIFKDGFKTKEFSVTNELVKKFKGTITFEGNTEIGSDFAHTSGNTEIKGPFKANSITAGAQAQDLIITTIPAKTVKISGTIETQGDQKYNGPVTLAGDSTLKTTANISFNDTLDGNFSLTIGDTVATNAPANVTFSKAIGATTSLRTLNINAAKITIPETVKTTETQTYTGPVELGKETTTLNATAGDISFSADIKGDQNLTIKNEANKTSFTANLTGIKVLDITSSEIALPKSVSTSGRQTYNGSITSGTLSLTTIDKNININSGIKATGPVTFTPGTGTISLNGTISSTGNQTYNGLVAIATDSILQSAFNTIIFEQPIKGPKQLTINDTKIVDFKTPATVGSATPLSNLFITATENINMPVSVTTSDKQSYTGKLTLKTPSTTLTGAEITLTDNIEGESSTLVINAATVNYNDITDSKDTSTSLGKIKIFTINGTTPSSSATTINISGDVELGESLTFNSENTVLKGNVNIQSKLNATPTVTFDTLIDSDSANTKTLKLTNINTAEFKKKIGSSATLETLDLTTTKTSVTLPASVNATNIDIVAAGTKKTPAISLTAPTSLTGTNINISDNINSPANSLSIENSGILNFYDSGSTGDIDGKASLSSFTQTDTAGSVNLAGDITATGNISFATAITLTDNVALIGKNISLSGTIKDNNNGDKSLILGDSPTPPDTAKTENITIGGAITDIASLEANATTAINLNANVKTTKAQNYHGPVTLAETVATTTTTATADEGNIHFYDTVTPKKDTATANFKDATLTLQTQAEQNVIFGGKILLTTITDSDNKGNIKILAGGSTTADTTIKTDGQLLIQNDSSSEQTFYSQNLIHTTGDTVIKGTVQSVSITLNKLSVEGNITTDKNQIYKGPVTLTKATNLKINETETSHVTFENTSSLVLASKNLTINGHTLYEGGNITAGNINSAGNDFIIQPTNSPSEISAAISAKNILIDTSNQSITLNKAKITATSDGSTQDGGDIAIFGPKFNTTDQVSGTTDIYTYNYVSPLKPTLPIKKTGTEKLNVTGSSSLNSKNLYINGTTVYGAETLTLSFADNCNTIANYATAYYSDFSGATVTIPIGKLVTEACILKPDNSQNSNNGWDSEDFAIKQAYTIDDDVIAVEFNRPVRFIYDTGNNGLNFTKSNKILNSNGKYNDIFYTKDSSDKFTAITPKETTGNPAYTSISTVYLTSPETWNTDATGDFDGYGTDKTGIHKQNIKPYLEIPRNKARNKSDPDGFSYFITDLYGKRLVDYSGIKKYDKNHEITPPSGTAYTPSYDQCAPIILSVSTGQELHDIDPKKWEHYDSHNFIEFNYSEPVMIGTDPLLNPDRIPSDGSKYKIPPKNITPTNESGIISNNSTGFNIAGIASIEKGHVSTGTKDNNEDFSVNTFYRRNPSTFRIAIAGKTSGSATDETLTWDGFINEGTTLPEGIVTPFANEKSTVKDYNGNCVVQFHDITLPPEGPVKTPLKITVSNEYTVPNGGNSSEFTYGGWDIYPPMFAPLNIPEGDTIHWTDNPGNQYEILGYSSGGTKLEELEFHLFDNTINTTPNNANNLNNIWYSSMGWYNHNTQKTACADIFGGSRPFSENEKSRTTGGIRFHTINQNAFHYTVGNKAPGKFLSVKPKAESTFFLGYSTSKDFPHNPTGELYFKLELDDKTHTIDTVFSLSYMPTKDTGYVTDLAGNKLKTINSLKPISSIDRTPPTFNMTLSPINHKEIFVIFSKKLQTNMERLTFKKKTPTGIELVEINENSSLEAALPHCFRFIKIDSSGNVIESADVPKIDTTVQAECHDFKKKNGKIITTVKLTLDRNITYEDLKSCYLQLAPTPAKDGSLIETSYDSMTGIVNAEVTLVRDNIGNFMKMYSAHATSDFAINFVNPLYAHTPDIKNNGASFGYGLYKDGSWAVHDWSRNQQNYGSVYANEKVEIVTSIDNGEKDKSKGLPQGIVMYITEKPDPESVSTQINGDLQEDYRIWLPKINPDVIFPAMSFVNNSYYTTLNGVFPTYTVTEGTNKVVKDDLTKSTFTIDKELAEKYGTNKQMTFMFGLSDSKITDPGNFTPVTILSNLFVKSKNTYDLEKSERSRIPLYCLRLEDPSDIASIDMWSYKTHSITLQRGGVTIFNNVINATYGEDTMLKVNVPTDGELSVMVLTLDGNIVKYLHRGNIKTGEYNYFWDGTNNNNEKVARGLYFIRVVGAGLDENRKVIVTR